MLIIEYGQSDAGATIYSDILRARREKPPYIETFARPRWRLIPSGYEEYDTKMEIIGVELLKPDIEGACILGKTFGWKGTRFWIRKPCSGKFRIIFKRIKEKKYEKERRKLKINKIADLNEIIKLALENHIGCRHDIRKVVSLYCNLKHEEKPELINPCIAKICVSLDIDRQKFLKSQQKIHKPKNIEKPNQKQDKIQHEKQKNKQKQKIREIHTEKPILQQKTLQQQLQIQPQTQIKQIIEERTQPHIQNIEKKEIEKTKKENLIKKYIPYIIGGLTLFILMKGD